MIAIGVGKTQATIALPMAGLLGAWDLGRSAADTPAAQSIASLYGLTPALQLGSTAGVDANDPAPVDSASGYQFTTDDYMLTPAINGLSLAGDWTVLMVAKSSGSMGAVFSLASPGSMTQWQYVTRDSAGLVNIRSADGTSSGNIAVPTTGYALLAARRVGSQLSIQRVDTGVSASVSSNPYAVTARLGLGCLARFTVGVIADSLAVAFVAVYNRALTSGEVSQAYRWLKSSRGFTI